MMFAFDWCYSGLVQWAWMTMTSICCLTVGTHYKPRHTKPKCNGLSQFKEDTSGLSIPVREFNLTAPG